MSGLWTLSSAKPKKIRRLKILFTVLPKHFGLKMYIILRCDDEQALAASLKSGIPSMVNALLSSGLNVSVDLDELHKNEALLS